MGALSTPKTPPTTAPADLSLLVDALERQDEVDVELAGRCALHRGVSLLTVFEAVLADLERLRSCGAGVLEVSDGDVRAKRVFCRLGAPARRDAAPALVFIDRVDALTVALIRLLEDGGLRARTVVSTDPALVLDLTAEQPWALVVVDHTSLRRAPQTAAQFLSPLLEQSGPRVVVTTDRWDSTAIAEQRRLGWADRRLRPLVQTCGLTAENPLTEREREVLTAVAAGRSNEQVGRMLQLSLSTVKTYLERVHAKLGSVDRASAVATALRRGWI